MQYVQANLLVTMSKEDYKRNDKSNLSELAAIPYAPIGISDSVPKFSWLVQRSPMLDSVIMVDGATLMRLGYDKISIDKSAACDLMCVVVDDGNLTANILSNVAKEFSNVLLFTDGDKQHISDINKASCKVEQLLGLNLPEMLNILHDGYGECYVLVPSGSDLSRYLVELGLISGIMFVYEPVQ